MTSALHSQPLVLARTPMASAALLLVRLYMRRTGANARFDRTSYRWTSCNSRRLAAACAVDRRRLPSLASLPSLAPRPRTNLPPPHSRRSLPPPTPPPSPPPPSDPTLLRCPRIRFAATLSSSFCPSLTALSTEMPPLSPSHASPPSHRRRYRCCPDPGAGARVPTLTTTTTVAAPSAPPPPPPSPPRPHTRARHAPRSVTRRTGLQIVLCTQLNSTGLY